MKTRSSFAMVVVCLLLCVGCGQNVHVTGNVSFEDGSPLTKGTLMFQSESFQATAPIEEDGSFKVGTVNPGDGIPRGTYQVYIAGATEFAGISPTGASQSAPVALVDSKYTSPDTSDLTCEVNGNMMYDITVVRP